MQSVLADCVVNRWLVFFLGLVLAESAHERDGIDPGCLRLFTQNYEYGLSLAARPATRSCNIYLIMRHGYS